VKQENIDINLGSRFDAKGFKQAETATDKLVKSTKKLAGAFGLAFGARAIVQFGRSSVRALAEAEKANTRLANSVKNLGLSLSTADIQKNLDEISAKTGIAGEPLAAAYQSLLTTTGSVIKSQELFNQALDISAGSGVELGTVTQDLSNAYVGITKGLKKYNLGLTQNELKTKSFAEVSALLNKQFTGSNARYLETYAGKIAVLGEAAGNAQEIIGAGLVDALMILSGDTTVEELADTMARLATNTSEALVNIGKFGRGIADTIGPIASSLEKFVQATQPFADLIFAGDPTGFMDKPKSTARRSFAGGQDSVKAGQASAAEKLAAKRQKEILATQKQQLKITKEQTALQKAGTLFDIQQAGIIAALKGKITDEERTRLELQLAILTGNSTEASKLAGELAKSQGLTKELVAYLAALPDAKNPFSAWKSYLDAIEAQVRRISMESPGAPVSSMAAGYGANGAQYSLPNGSMQTSAAGVDFTVNVNAGSIIAQEQLQDVLRDTLLDASLSAKFSAIFRQGGSFGP
jgi:hypothetical protein